MKNEIEIKRPWACKFEPDEIIEIVELKPHPKNANKHSKEQIERLAKLLKYQGFRKPIIVSALSDFIVTGHGTIEAAKLNGWTTVPVSFQDFEDEAQEYAHMIADNAVASWSDLDLSMINNDFSDFGPELDIELLGVEHFDLDPESKQKEESEGSIDIAMYSCPHCQMEFELNQAERIS